MNEPKDPKTFDPFNPHGKKGLVRVAPPEPKAVELMMQTPVAPWERQPNEPEAAYNAFLHWLSNRPESDVQAYEDGAVLSSKFEWQKRAIAWDQECRVRALCPSGDPHDKLAAMVQLQLDTALIEEIKANDLARSTQQLTTSAAERMKVVELATDPERLRSSDSGTIEDYLAECTTPEEKLAVTKALMAGRRKASE